MKKVKACSFEIVLSDFSCKILEVAIALLIKKPEDRSTPKESDNKIVFFNIKTSFCCMDNVTI